MPSYSDMRLLAVHAHPDDEASKGAATVVHYRRLGVDVMVVTCTGGESGSILNSAMESVPHARRDLAGYRRQEMDRAAKALDIRHRWLGYTDSGLPEGDPLPPLPEGSFGLVDPAVAAGELVKVIREFKPQVMTTYDENGGYPHPDHVMCNRVSLEAFRQAADPELWPEHGPAWQVSKLYYHMNNHRLRLAALDAAMHEEGMDSPYAERLAQWEERDLEKRVTTRIPSGDWFEVRDAALIAHASQIDPDGHWFAVPIELQKRVWPTEDFELVESRVKTHLPEDDLFAGLRGPVTPSAAALGDEFVI